MTLLNASLMIALVVSLALVMWLWSRLATLQQEHDYEKQKSQSCHALDVSSAPSILNIQSTNTFPRLFHAVAASIDVGLIIVNDEHQVQFLNTQSRELLDIGDQPVENKGLISLMRDYQVDTMLGEVLHDHESRELAVELLTNNRTLHVRCTALVCDDSTSGAILIIRDITQINMLERSRRDLVANVSHELRTPLASLKLLVETVQSQPPPDVTQRMLGQMIQEIDEVTQLADELHELSQIEAGRVSIKLSPGDIDIVIKKTLNRIETQAERKHITVEYDATAALPPVLMDEQRIGQVLINLLHNAIKFTPDKGTITVCTAVESVHEQVPHVLLEHEHAFSSATHSASMHVSQWEHNPTLTNRHEETNGVLPEAHPPGQWFVLSITDTGIGIPSRDVPRIFERFYKVDRSRNRDVGGTGLGLAIAKHLVEGHGGRLWVRSKEGSGSTFYLTLPMA